MATAIGRSKQPTIKVTMVPSYLREELNKARSLSEVFCNKVTGDISKATSMRKQVSVI